MKRDNKVVKAREHSEGWVEGWEMGREMGDTCNGINNKKLIK